jgi:hypothetical protein
MLAYQAALAGDNRKGGSSQLILSAWSGKLDEIASPVDNMQTCLDGT